MSDKTGLTKKQKTVMYILRAVSVIFVLALICEVLTFLRADSYSKKGRERPEITYVNDSVPVSKENETDTSYDYVLNLNSQKIHLPTCEACEKMCEDNKFFIKEDELDKYLSEGYEYCSICFFD